MIADPAAAVMQHVYDQASAWVAENTASESGGGNGGAGVARWRSVVLQALARVGQPASLADTVLRRMNQESGGNPNAINLWDSNAKRGTPSRGLMQTIPSTFAAYRDPGLPNNIVDPLANIVASMNYALKRYGSLSAAYNRKGGYDSGGVANGVGVLPKYTVEPERVLSPRQTVAFEQMVDGQFSPAGGSSGAAGSNTPMVGEVHFHEYGGTADAAMDALAFEMRKLKRGSSSFRRA
jgi:hypothetical protein